VKQLREYEDAGLIYTAGRSAAGYRLFDNEALWCVGVISSLRGMGLTLAEIRDLASVYLNRPDVPVGPHMASVLSKVRARIDARLDELRQLRQRIEEFEVRHAAELAGRGDFRDSDPHFQTRRT
jgi:MerR family transcriptional regulator, copper efflux regulator